MFIPLLTQPGGGPPGPWGTGVSGIPGGSIFGQSYGVGEALVEAITAAVNNDYGGDVSGNVLVGWPTPNQLNQIIANAGGQITVFPNQGTWRNAGRYRPTYDIVAYENPPQLQVGANGRLVTFSGTVDQATVVTFTIVPFGSTRQTTLKISLSGTDSPQTAATAFIAALKTAGTFRLLGLNVTPTTVLVVGACVQSVKVAPAAVLTPNVSGNILSFTGLPVSSPFGQPYIVNVFVGPSRELEVNATVQATGSDTILALLPKVAQAINGLLIPGIEATVTGTTVLVSSNWLSCNVGMQATLLAEVDRVSGIWQVSVWMPEPYSRSIIEEVIFENVGTEETPFLQIGSSPAAIYCRYAGGSGAGWVDRSQSDYGCYEAHLNFFCEWPILRPDIATQIGAVKPQLAALGGS